MRTIAVAFFTLLFMGGYIWHQADRAAVDRAEYLAEPISEDETVTVGFSASGFLNRDVRVVAFDFGLEDQTIGDAYADQILHGDLAEEFYREGFRRVITSGSDAVRSIAPRQAHATISTDEPSSLPTASIRNAGS